MTKEFNLSEKIESLSYAHIESPNNIKFIKEDDVKEFIKRAREILDNCMSGDCDRELILNNFDKLAGDKLK